MTTDRKTLIADAALALLGSVGARGLTHRGVDTQAGLPSGSTSFYCRTRFDLLATALKRHAELDMADLAADAEAWGREGLTPQRFVDTLATRIADWLSPAKRERLVARFELFLIASREPELAAVVSAQRGGFLHGTVAALRAAGVASPEAVAPGLLMLVDGMLLDHVAGSLRPLSAAQRKAALRRTIGLVPTGSDSA